MTTTEEMLYGSPGPDWKPNTKMLYVTASANGWTHQGVKDLILANFKRTSTKDLSFSEYHKVMRWLGNSPPDVITMERDPNTLEMFP